MPLAHRVLMSLGAADSWAIQTLSVVFFAVAIDAIITPWEASDPKMRNTKLWDAAYSFDQGFLA